MTTSSDAVPAPSLDGPTGGVGSGGVGKSVRRIIVFGVLFVLVCLAVGGISDLLTRVLDSGRVLVGDDVPGLALNLSFAFIAGPLVAVLWWFSWRMAAAHQERIAITFGLYLAIMSTVALIAATTSLLQAASSLLDGDWQPATFSLGLLWLGVWAWHAWMRWHPQRSSLRLTGATPTVGYVYGVVIFAAGTVNALVTLFDLAIVRPTDLVVVSAGWWIPVLQGAVWAVGGATIWWWHWKHEGVEALRAGLANVALVLVAGLGSVLLALAGIAAGIFVLLSLVLGTGVGGDTLPEVLKPLSPAVAAASVGSLIWAYFRRPARNQSTAVETGTLLVTSGITLAATASGLGILVNSILAAVGSPLVETGPRALLFGGISALVVGAISWWSSWKPTAPASTVREAVAGRRIYLIAVFGVSAIVAVITVLVIGFRIFEFTLDPVASSSFLDRVRAELGLLVATGLVASYHFTLWNRDRVHKAAAPTKKQTISQLTLVVGADASRLAQLFAEATGGAVTVLSRADTGESRITSEAITAADVSGACSGISAVRAIAIIGPMGEIEVIPLRA